LVILHGDLNTVHLARSLSTGVLAAVFKRIRQMAPTSIVVIRGYAEELRASLRPFCHVTVECAK